MEPVNLNRLRLHAVSLGMVFSRGSVRLGVSAFISCPWIMFWQPNG